MAHNVPHDFYLLFESVQRLFVVNGLVQDLDSHILASALSSQNFTEGSCAYLLAHAVDFIRENLWRSKSSSRLFNSRQKRQTRSEKEEIHFSSKKVLLRGYRVHTESLAAKKHTSDSSPAE